MGNWRGNTNYFKFRSITRLHCLKRQKTTVYKISFFCYFKVSRDQTKTVFAEEFSGNSVCNGVDEELQQDVRIPDARPTIHPPAPLPEQVDCVRDIHSRHAVIWSLNSFPEPLLRHLGEALQLHQNF